MPFYKGLLRNSSLPVRLGNGRSVRFLNYATNDTKAEVMAAGYFNDARLDLSVGSIIEVSHDNDGTPAFHRLMVNAVPSSGNITTSDITSGQGGGAPSLGYFFMQIQQPGGSYAVLSTLNPDTSRSNIQGKAA